LVVRRLEARFPTSSASAEERALGAERKREAQGIDRAREIVHRSGGGEVVIHRPDGSIGDSDTVSPGQDPDPPRDRR
jgi:Uncharacterized protein conserved in bacteria (DUF2188)